MKKILLALLILLLALPALADHPPMPDKADLLEVVCVRPVDGDTAWFEEISGLVVHKVRFIGVDTPETVHPDKPVQEYGPEASAFTKEMLFGKTVWLEYDVEEYDRYARHLCYIWLEDGSLFNLTLIEEGYGIPSIYPPNVKYVEWFTSAQKGEVTTEPDAGALMVWVSKTGTKYHKDSTCCNMKNPVMMSIDAAEAIGLTKCKKCW